MFRRSMLWRLPTSASPSSRRIQPGHQHRVPPLQPPRSSALYHALIGSALYGTASFTQTTSTSTPTTNSAYSDVDLVTVFAYSAQELLSAFPSLDTMVLQVRHKTEDEIPFEEEVRPWFETRFPNALPRSAENLGDGCCTGEVCKISVEVDATQWELGYFVENVLVGKGLEALCSPHRYVVTADDSVVGPPARTSIAAEQQIAALLNLLRTNLFTCSQDGRTQQTQQNTTDANKMRIYCSEPLELTVLHHLSIARGCAISVGRGVASVMKRTTAAANSQVEQHQQDDKKKKKKKASQEPADISQLLLSTAKTMVQCLRHTLVTAELLHYLAAMNVMQRCGEQHTIPNHVLERVQNNVPEMAIEKLLQLHTFSTTSNNNGSSASLRIASHWAKAVELKANAKRLTTASTDHYSEATSSAQLLLGELTAISKVLLHDVDTFHREVIMERILPWSAITDGVEGKNTRKGDVIELLMMDAAKANEENADGPGGSGGSTKKEHAALAARRTVLMSNLGAQCEEDQSNGDHNRVLHEFVGAVKQQVRSIRQALDH